MDKGLEMVNHVKFIVLGSCLWVYFRYRVYEIISYCMILKNFIMALIPVTELKLELS